jgi:hypothetical protein
MARAGHIKGVEEMRNVYRFCSENLTENTTWEMVTDGSIILKRTLETGCESADSIQMVQGRVRSRALANTVMNHRVPQKMENFCSSYYQILKKDSVPWSRFFFKEEDMSV